MEKSELEIQGYYSNERPVIESFMKMWEESLLKNSPPKDNKFIQELLEYCANAIRCELPLSPALRKYISRALFDMSMGKGGDESFGISFNKGRKNTRRSEVRDEEIAWFISGLSKRMIDRYEEASEIFFVSPDTAKRAWVRNRRRILERRALFVSLIPKGR